MSGKIGTVISGLSIITPLGDSPDELIQAAYDGKSAVTRWQFFDDTRCYSKIGGDLSRFDLKGRTARVLTQVPPAVKQRAEQCLRRAPWSTRFSILTALNACIDSAVDWDLLAGSRTGVIVCGTNLNLNYHAQNLESYRNEPDFIDPLLALALLDTNHASVISEIIGAKSFAYTVGAACASCTLGLQKAREEIDSGRADRVVVLAPVVDYSPLYLQGLAMMGAISVTSFNDRPSAASRPFDRRREGFVPAHGGAAVIVESAAAAQNRRANIYAHIEAIELNSSAHSGAVPDRGAYVAGLERLFSTTQVKPQDIDFVSAHATSTPVGDLAELDAIKSFFGPHSEKLLINAPKSVVAHTTSSAALVELVLGILQMRMGKIHGSWNIDELDPEIDLNVCANRNVEKHVKYFLKNSFGFGGSNSFILIRNPQE